MIAAPQIALEAAAQVARDAGLTPLHPRRRLEGEARDVGKALAGIARQVALRGQPFAPPCVLLSGGETTVTMRGDGRGGRNVEFLLALGRGARRPARRARHGRRHRRRRRRRGNRRRDRSPPTPSRAPGRRASTRAPARRQRRPRLLPGARRLGRHRADADQRQRLPRHRHRRRCNPGTPHDPPATQRQDRRHPRPGECRPRHHRGAGSRRRRRLPPQLQPRHARRPQGAARHHPRDRERSRPPDRRAARPAGPEAARRHLRRRPGAAGRRRRLPARPRPRRPATRRARRCRIRRSSPR